VQGREVTKMKKLTDYERKTINAAYAKGKRLYECLDSSVTVIIINLRRSGYFDFDNGIIEEKVTKRLENLFKKNGYDPYWDIR
jgi:hypothetical protein